MLLLTAVMAHSNLFLTVYVPLLPKHSVQSSVKKIKCQKKKRSCKTESIHMLFPRHCDLVELTFLCPDDQICQQIMLNLLSAHQLSLL